MIHIQIQPRMDGDNFGQWLVDHKMDDYVIYDFEHTIFTFEREGDALTFLIGFYGRAKRIE